MITNFDKYTYELTDYERDTLAPFIAETIKKRRTRETAITNKRIRYFIKLSFDKVVGGYCIRKIVHNLRITGQVPNLLSTSNGYYVSSDEEEIRQYLESLRERCNSIEAVIRALKEQLAAKHGDGEQLELWRTLD